MERGPDIQNGPTIRYEAFCIAYDAMCKALREYRHIGNRGEMDQTSYGGKMQEHGIVIQMIDYERKYPMYYARYKKHNLNNI